MTTPFWTAFSSIRKLLHHRPTKITRVVISHGLELLLIWILFIGNSENAQKSNLEVLVGISYTFTVIRIINLDILLCVSRADDELDWQKLNNPTRKTVFIIICLLNVICVVPQLFSVSFEHLLISVVSIQIILYTVLKELYLFFVDFVLVKNSRTFLSSILYIAVKCLHMYFLKVFSSTMWIILVGGLTNWLLVNGGLVEYEAASIDANGIRKCYLAEHLPNMAARNFGREKVTCSAIIGEYVTFNCKFYPYQFDDNILFSWIKEFDEIISNEKYKINTEWQEDVVSRKFILHSNLTIYGINTSDFDTYTCVVKTHTCKKPSAKDSFVRLLYGKKICNIPSASVLISSITLEQYKGSNHVIRASLGYLIKLRNVFPLRLLQSETQRVTLTNRDYELSYELSFEYCFESIKRFYKLKQVNNIDQLSETTFCAGEDYGTYVLSIKQESGHEIVHPNSLTILPKPKSGAIFLIDSKLFRSLKYENLITNLTSFDQDNPVHYLINIVEVLIYLYTRLTDTVENCKIIIVTLIALVVEMKIYRFLLNHIRISMGFHGDERLKILQTQYDIFLSFSEQSPTDQTFVVDKLLPYLETNQGLKVRSCHTIKSGSHLFETYSSEIQTCKKVVILWSDDYADDDQCKQILSAVIFGLHSNEILRLSDILTLKYRSSKMPLRYSYLLHEYSVDVPNDSESSLHVANYFIKTTFHKDEKIIDKMKHNTIVKLLVYLSAYFYSLALFTRQHFCTVVHIYAVYWYINDYLLKTNIIIDAICIGYFLGWIMKSIRKQVVKYQDMFLYPSNIRQH